MLRGRGLSAGWGLGRRRKNPASNPPIEKTTLEEPSGRLYNLPSPRWFDRAMHAITALLPGRIDMTIDKSLKVKAGSVKDRNVLKRSERLAQRMAQGTWDESSTVLGMAKTRVRKITMKKKKKVKSADDK